MEWFKRAKTSDRGLGAVSAAVRPMIHVTDAKPQQVILLPSRSLRASSPDTSRFLRAMSDRGVSAAVKDVGGPPVRMTLIDSIHEDGAKLVELSASEAQKLRAVQPGLQIVPVRYYEPAVRFYQVENKIKTAGTAAKAAARKVMITIVSKTDGTPIGGATVVAFTNFANREGAGGQTSSAGKVSLTLPSSVKTLERLYVYPADSFWGSLKRRVKLSSSGTMSISLIPIDLSFQDGVRHFPGSGGASDGQGVKVAVVDTGIALGHPDLTVVGGECTVPGEAAGTFGPLGGDHGSHCAGIIAAHGSPPNGIRGIAPAAELFSYRVFPTPTAAEPEPGASNFSIAKAIDRATAAGVDLMNLSLGGGDPDPVTEQAIKDARAAGAVVIAAAGNDDRSPVSSPASFDLCVAVSALGRKGTFPKGTVDDGDVAKPFGTDKKNFIALFSNVGAELDCTGPGVGIISTVPDTKYAVMSGTSMATPAVVGICARLLSKNAALLGAARDASRADGIVKMLLQSCTKLGLGPTFEGQGLPG